MIEAAGSTCSFFLIILVLFLSPKESCGQEKKTEREIKFLYSTFLDARKVAKEHALKKKF